MNQVTICGYLGKDFEMNVVGKDKEGNDFYCAKNSLGISETKKIKNGNDLIETTHTDWIPITIFGKKAQTANNYLKKGDKFLGVGKIYTSTWPDKETGETRYGWQVIIKNFEFVHKEHKEVSNNEPPKNDEAQLNEEDIKIIETEESDLPF